MKSMTLAAFLLFVGLTASDQDRPARISAARWRAMNKWLCTRRKLGEPLEWPWYD